MGFLQSAAGLRSSPVTEKFSCTQGLKTKLPVRKVVFRTEAANYAVDDHGQLARPEDLPLSGKRVLVTAPRRYASRLVGRLVEAGALPLWIPTIEITALNRPDDLKSLDDALTCLEDYTHIAFTSSNGITAVLDRLEALHGGKAGALKAVHRAGLRCCALGADADVLESHGVPCSIRPKEASTLGLVKELVDRGEAEGASVLCPVPLVEGDLVEPPVVPRFLRALEEAGARPRRVAAYITQSGSAARGCRAELKLLRSGVVDAVAFSSTAEAQGLVRAMGGTEGIKAAVREKGVVLAAHGPFTAAGASAVLGVSVDCVSKDFSSFAGLVAALEDEFWAQ